MVHATCQATAKTGPPPFGRKPSSSCSSGNGDEPYQERQKTPPLIKQMRG